MAFAQSSDLPPMSESEYLAFADERETKHEYKQGYAYAILGASVRHNTITANMIAHLVTALTEHDCTVTTSDTRIHIASKQSYRYPDVTVFCGEASYLKDRADTITNPILLVEVLSTGTAIIDYNEKLEEYTRIESLQAYILVAQDSPKIEVFHRHDNQWLYEVVTGLEADFAITLLEAPINLSLAQIYRRIQWETTDNDTE